MNEWFHERYIDRAEHEQVVAYYSKLVAQLYGQLKQLRAADPGLAALDALAAYDRDTPSAVPERVDRPSPATGGEDNVITVDFTRRH